MGRMARGLSVPRPLRPCALYFMSSANISAREGRQLNVLCSTRPVGLIQRPNDRRVNPGMFISC